MSVNKAALYGTGVVTLAGIGFYVYWTLNQKKKDRLSYTWQVELEKVLDPKNVISDPLFDTSKVVPSNFKLNNDEHNSIADNIWGAWGYMNDDEDVIYSQLRLITTRDDYKAVSKKYITKSGGVSLDIDLKERLSDDEYSIVAKIFKGY